MSNLAMSVPGLPAGLRLTQLSRDHAADLTDLVRAKELTFFQRSETNTKEILGTLSAPELDGTRGTAGVWDDGRLLAAMLAFNGLQHERGLYLDLFISPHAPNRRGLATTLLTAGERYGQTLPAPDDAYLKVESFGGDREIRQALAERGYERHRVYLRMRVDFVGETPRPRPVPGISVKGMSEDLWPELHRVVTESFRDHYDSHPLPFDLFRRDMINETTDLDRWRLAFDGPTCVGVSIGSRRFEPEGLGYVETLGVLREYRGRGIARHLLLDAMARDAAAGLTGTSLHCDATNPTGATALYESVGMRRDHEYVAWRTPLQAENPSR
ncbi:MAG: GNAT family N-acetyltransferase [Candidatus Nanopelagicales bacterium]|nr:GNAT family N-acetyltransferase [Candidatus Nanopelagicales bacterium]